MRAIVELFRYVVIGTLGLLIALMVFGGLELASVAGLRGPYVALYAAGAVVLLILVVLALGLTATIVSIHDLHADLVDEVRTFRDEFYAPAGRDE